MPDNENQAIETMLISTIMTQPVVTIGPDKSILQAKAKLDSRRIRHLPVVGQDSVLLGIITDRDLRGLLPSRLDQDLPARNELKKLSTIKVKDIMVKEPYTLSLSHSLQNALVLFQRTRVGAFPVVDERRRAVGILSKGDLLSAFTHVLGIDEPGTLLGVVVEQTHSAVMAVVQAIEAAGIAFGSILVARDWDEGHWAVFAYLFSLQTTGLKRRLERMGCQLIEPLEK
jgi:acetoin utilization protein AcuB